MAGFDQSGVDGTDRNLVHPGALDGDKREMFGAVELGRIPGVAAHRVPVLGPVCVSDQSAHLRVSERTDPVQVGHLPLESAGGEGQCGQRRQFRVFRRYRALDFNATIGPAGEEQVDDPEPAVLLAGRHQTKPKPLPEKIFCLPGDAVRR